jgi:CPA1 family monovalent cation:H+ antiporter
MNAFQTLALLLTFAAAGAYVNRRFLKLPATIGLMVFALMVSLAAIGLNRLGWVNLHAASTFVAGIDFSNILLHGMLSFLLFAGALQIDFSDLKKHHTIIVVLATVGVVIATFTTGSLIWLAAGWFGLPFPYIYALLFGALISPTDPIAVLGILKETSMSRNLRVKIGCESLLNDGVGVVLFLVLLSIATHPHQPISSDDIVLSLLWQGGGSVALGLALGWITHELLGSVDDYKVEVLLTLALVSGGYALAELIHVSAPITMVIAGLVIGNHSQIFGVARKPRRHVDLFWELLEDILNMILFALMGLEMMVIHLSSLHLAVGLAVILAVLVGRFVSVALPVTLMRLRYRFERGTITLLTWGGLRGGISIAMALSLPPGPEKDLILGMTYITVIFSVLVQGTTFRHVTRALIKQ